MTRIQEISDIYDLKLKRLHNADEWEKTLKRTSAFWKTSFCEAMLITAQKPSAKMCGTLEQWNKIGRYIKRGERSIAVFKSRTDTQLIYLFDEKQTYGKAFNAKWEMSENIADGIVGKFNAESSDSIVNSLEEYLQKGVDRSLKNIYENISRELKKACEIDVRILRFIRESAECICMTRCGIEKNYDFSAAEKLADEVSLIEIGNTANVLAQDVLNDVDKIIRRKEYEIYRADVCGRPLRYPLRAEQGRTFPPEVYGLREETNDPVGVQGSRFDERTRPDSARFGQYKRIVPDNLERDRTEIGENSRTNRRKSSENNDIKQNLQRTNEAAGGNSGSGEPRSVGNTQNERELAVKGNTQAERTESDKRNSAELRELTGDEDLSEYSEENDELTEGIYDETVSENEDTVSYLSDKPVLLNSDTSFAQNLLDAEITYGNGFVNGKFQINDYIKSENPSDKALADFLKKEYGTGGSTRNDNTILFANYSRKGICLEIKGENGERQNINYSWSQAAKAVKKAVEENRYITKNDEECRARIALAEAKRFTLHYSFPQWYANERVGFIRNELKACGVEFYLKMTTEMWVVYASEALQEFSEKKEKYDSIDKSKVVNKDNAIKYISEPDKKAFTTYCQAASSNLISRILSNSDGIPSLGFTIDELRDFFSNDEILDHTINSISENVFNFLYSRDSHKILWSQKSEDKTEDDIQPTLLSGTKNKQISLLDKEYTNRFEERATDKPKVTQVAIESTNDFFDDKFHAELVNADVQNSDGSYGQVKDFYRVVTVGENGALEPYDTKVFESRDEARKAIMNNGGLTEISYNEIARKAFEKMQNISVRALKDYAESHIAYYDSEVRKAFLHGNRDDFNDSVHQAIDRTISEVLSGELSIEGNFSELYKEMRENIDFAEALYSEISQKLYAKHIEINKARQAAHDVGLPFEEYPEEDFDQYAYDPNRMSGEDYDNYDTYNPEIAENHERKQQGATNQALQFGLLGNGITVYDTSKTDPETRDYPTVAHISNEGNIKYYVDKNSINAEDITRIETQAQQQKAKFTVQWNEIPIEERYARILEQGMLLPKPQFDVFHYDNLTMEEKVKKYEHSIIFRDEDFPENTEKKNAETVQSADEQALYTQQKSVIDLETGKKQNDFATPVPKNYRFPDDFSYPNNAKARYYANVLAIKTLKKIEAEHRSATAEEQDILAHYSGWGGTADAFDNTKENWSKEYAELKELLSEKEFSAARESTLTAFYTEPYIIKSIYKALENFGFTGGYILDETVA